MFQLTLQIPYPNAQRSVQKPSTKTPLTARQSESISKHLAEAIPPDTGPENFRCRIGATDHCTITTQFWQRVKRPKLIRIGSGSQNRLIHFCKPLIPRFNSFAFSRCISASRWVSTDCKRIFPRRRWTSPELGSKARHWR